MVWFMNAPGLFASVAGWQNESPHSTCLYRFYISGGNIYLRRRLVLTAPPGDDTSHTMIAHTLSWRLKAALFS